MARRVLEVVLVGDERSLKGALGKAGAATAAFGKQAETHSNRVGRSFMAVGKAGGIMATVLVGSVVAGLKKSADAAEADQVSKAKLAAQLKALGISYKTHQKVIDGTISKEAELSGVLDKDVRDAFTNIIRVTGNVKKSLDLTSLALDFARARHMDVAKAGELMGKVAGGNVGILSRYGLSMQKVTTHVDALANAHGKVTIQQKRAAAEADKMATAQKALGVLQDKFAGQAKAYGETTAGAQDRFRVAVDHLEVSLGNKLLPVLAKVFGAMATFVQSLQDGTGAGGRFAAGVAAAFDTAKNAVSTAITAIKGFLEAHKKDLDDLGKAFQNIGTAIAFVFTDIIWPVVQRVLPAIKTMFEGTIKVIQGIVQVFAGLFSGDWSKLWEGIKNITSGALSFVEGAIRAMTAPIRAAMAAIGHAISEAASAAWDTVKDIFRTALGVAVGIVRGYVDNMASAGSAIIHGVASGIRDAAGAIGDAVSFIGGKIVGTLKGFIDDVAHLGAEIGQAIFNGIKGVVSNIASFVKNAINSALPDHITIPLPIGDIHIPIPQLARGTNYFQGGLAIVGERGPELVSMPQGSQVFPNSQARGMVGGVNVNIAGDMVLKSGTDHDRWASRLAFKIATAS